MSESTFNNDPEFHGFDPSLMVRSLQAGLNVGDFDKEGIVSALKEYVPFMTDEEVGDTQRVVQEDFFVLGSLHEALVEHRIASLGAPNQARMANPEE